MVFVRLQGFVHEATQAEPVPSQESEAGGEDAFWDKGVAGPAPQAALLNLNGHRPDASNGGAAVAQGSPSPRSAGRVFGSWHSGRKKCMPLIICTRAKQVLSLPIKMQMTEVLCCIVSVAKWKVAYSKYNGSRVKGRYCCMLNMSHVLTAAVAPAGNTGNHLANLFSKMGVIQPTPSGSDLANTPAKAPPPKPHGGFRVPLTPGNSAEAPQTPGFSTPQGRSATPPAGGTPFSAFATPAGCAPIAALAAPLLLGPYAEFTCVGGNAAGGSTPSNTACLHAGAVAPSAELLVA